MPADNRTVFRRIIDGDLPADIVYQDEHCLAFRDVAPVAPRHILVIPRKEIRSLAELTDSDVQLMGHLMVTISRIAREAGMEAGYRVVTNIGQEGGQSVPHLHFHVLAGRKLTWPPG